MNYVTKKPSDRFLHRKLILETLKLLEYFLMVPLNRHLWTTPFWLTFLCFPTVAAGNVLMQAKRNVIFYLLNVLWNIRATHTAWLFYNIKKRMTNITHEMLCTKNAFAFDDNDRVDIFKFRIWWLPGGECKPVMKFTLLSAPPVCLIGFTGSLTVRQKLVNQKGPPNYFQEWKKNSEPQYTSRGIIIKRNKSEDGYEKKNKDYKVKVHQYQGYQGLQIKYMECGARCRAWYNRLLLEVTS